MKINKISKGFSLVSIILIIGVIAIGLVIFIQNKLPANQESQPATQTTPELSTSSVETKIDTSDWKTYRSNEYGFEISYPADWKVYPGPIPNIFLIGKEGPNEEMINIEVKKGIKVQKDYPESWMCTKIFLDDHEAFRCEGESRIEEMRGVKGPFIYKTIIVRLEYEGRIYTLSLSNDVKWIERFKIFDAMLSTFRFIN